ncbi:Huntingtin-associated protein [Dirofilaria immitis]
MLHFITTAFRFYFQLMRNVDEEKEERYGASFIVIDGKEGIVIRLVITAARVGIELRKQNLVIYRSVDKMESINQSISSDVLHFILFCAGRMEAIEMALLAVNAGSTDLKSILLLSTARNKTEEAKNNKLLD